MLKTKQMIPWALATLSGVLYFLGFVGFDQWYLAWVALVPLLVALQGAPSGRRALLLGGWMGFVAQLGGYHWIIYMLQTFGMLPLPAAVLGWLLLGVAQGAAWGLFGWLAWTLRARTGVALGWLTPLAVVASEFVYPLIFPSYFANALAWKPLFTQVADLGGALLVTAVLAVVNGALGELVLARLERRAPSRALLATAAAALIFDIGYGALRIRQMDARDAAAPTLRTAIIQANVGAGSKHTRAGEGIQRFREMTDEAMERIPDLGLVVWPESGFNRIVVGNVNLTGLVAEEVKVPMIVGVVRGERDASRPAGRTLKTWNSAVALAPGGDVIGSYDKTKRLVFGEYIPGGELFPQLYDLLPYTSHFEAGTSTAPLPIGAWRLSTDICYEDILPRLIRDLMGPLDSEGTRPHAMVNITNDSWYGPVEPRIHLALATFRSIEHRRWLIRSTATGISTFVDSSGRLVKPSGFETAETLVHDVPMVSGGPTLYGMIGDAVGWLAAALSALGLAWKRLRPDRERGEKVALRSAA